MLAKSTYLAALHREASAVVDAARLGLEAPVPSCPGWNIATLLSHLTADVYAPKIKLVRMRPQRLTFSTYEDLGLPPEFKDWFNGRGTDASQAPPGLVELYERTAADLEDALSQAEPDEPASTWWPPQQTVGFWQRRMAHETAVHRWDAQLAHGAPQPIEPELASDGIDETFEVMLPSRRGWSETARVGSGETYHFHRTDGPGEWLVRFAPDGPVVSREHAKGDAALRGPASDLLLFLWQRIPADRLEVFGDAALLDRYFQLVPPD